MRHTHFLRCQGRCRAFRQREELGTLVFVVWNSTQKVPFYSNIDYLLVEIY